MEGNKEQTRNDTRLLLENSLIESGTDTYSTGYNCKKGSRLLKNFENQTEQSKLQSCHLIYMQISIDSFLPKERIPSVTELFTEAMPSSVLYHGTVVFILRPVSLNQDTITPMMLPTTSTREGIERSPDTTARPKSCRDAIQSLCSAPISVKMMNFVTKSGSKLPKTTEAQFRRRLLRSRKSKTVYSTNFYRYPLTANSTYVSRNTFEPQPEQQVTLRDQQHSEVAKIQQPHDWPFYCTCSVQPHTLYGTCRGPTSERKQEWLLTPPRTPHWTGHTFSPSSQHAIRSAGTFHSAKLTANRISVKKMWNKRVIFRNQYLYDREQIRILTSTSLRDRQTSMFLLLVVKENCAHNCSTSF